MKTNKYAIAFRDEVGNTRHGIYASTKFETEKLNEVVVELQKQYPARGYRIDLVQG